MSNGFTLIELLVVISIIGILTALAVSSYTGSQKQTRDTQRKSDLNQYRIALEAYASANNDKYPGFTYDSAAVPIDIGAASESRLSGQLIPTYLTNKIADPMNSGNYKYYYVEDGTASAGPNANNYYLFALLETGDYWVICSNGKIGKKVSATSLTNQLPCPI